MKKVGPRDMIFFVCVGRLSCHVEGEPKTINGQAMRDTHTMLGLANEVTKPTKAALWISHKIPFDKFPQTKGICASWDVD